MAIVRVLILFVNLLVLATALQVDIEYEYQYHARIHTGIQEIRSQAAVVDIYADLLVQVFDDAVLQVQMINVEFAEYNGDMNCSFDEPFSVNYEQMPPGTHLEDPFLVYPLNYDCPCKNIKENNPVLEVTQGEEMWVTNIKKGVAGLLRNEATRGNFRSGSSDYISSKHSVPPVFAMNEHGIGGLCETRYTLHKLPPNMAVVQNADIESNMEEDVQRSSKYTGEAYTSKTGRFSSKTGRKGHKTSWPSYKSSRKGHRSPGKGKPEKYTSPAPSLEDDLWVMTRVVDYDRCTDLVTTQSTNGEIRGLIGSGHIDSIQSRSSTWQYILRGSGGAFRIESVTTDGEFVVNPFGIETEKIRATTKQNLELIAVRSHRLLLEPLNGHKVLSMYYEFISPMPENHHEREKYWVKFLNKANESPLNKEFFSTGFSVTEEDQDELYALIEIHLREAAGNLLSLPEGETPDWLSYLIEAGDLIAHLDESRLRKLYDNIFSRVMETDEMMQSLLIDITAANPSKHSVEILLEKMRKGEISSARATTILMTISNNILLPSSLHSFMDYALSLDLEENPVMAVTALMNVGKMIKKFCFHDHAEDWMRPMAVFGNDTCDHKKVLDEYLGTLEQKLQTSAKRWHRAVYIQGIFNLGTPHIIPIMRRCAFGEIDDSPQLRANAIYSFASWNLPEVARTQALEVLMTVFTNPGENYEVRQAAFAALTSWKPGAAWWHRVALSTWREPSAQMASFITSTIESLTRAEGEFYSDQRKLAKQVLAFAKPASVSFRRSVNWMENERIISEELSDVTKLAWLGNLQSFIPREFYMLFHKSLGGFRLKYFEMAFLGDGFQEGLDYLIKISRREKLGASDTVAAQVAQALYRKFTEQIGNIRRERQAFNVEAYVYFSLFNELQTAFALNGEVFRKLAETVNFEELMLEFVMGKPFLLTKYFNPLQDMAVFPTDVGLPVHFAAIAPVATNQDLMVQLNLESGFYDMMSSDDSSPKKFSVTVEGTSRISTKLHSSVSIILPWSYSKVSAGVETHRSVSLPFEADMTFDINEQFPKAILAVAPTVDEIELFKAVNTPFTALKPIVPLSKYRPSDLKVIRKKEKSFHRELPSLLEKNGIYTSHIWDADFQLPFTGIYFMSERDFDATTIPSTTAKYWRRSYQIDVTKSTTKKIKVIFSIAYPQKESEEFTQEGQEYQDVFSQFGADPFAQYDQQQSFDQDILEFARKAGGDAEIVEADTLHTSDYFSVDDTDEQRLRKINGLYGGGSVQWSLNVKFYGTEKYQYEFLGTFAPKKKNNNLKMYKMQFAAIAALPSVPNSLSICYDLEAIVPYVSFLDIFQDLDPSVLEYSFKGSFMSDCKERPITNDKVTVYVSNEQVQTLRENMHSYCEYDDMDPVNFFLTSLKYDRISAQFIWNEENYTPSNRAANCIADFRNGWRINTQVGKPTSSVPKSIEITAVREVPEHAWSFTSTVEGEKPANGKMTVNLDDFFSFEDVDMERKRCFITNSTVRNFDGLSYRAGLSSCYAVAAFDCTNVDGWVLLVKEGAELWSPPEARFIDPIKGIVVNMKDGQVRVNGKIIDPIGDEEIVKSDRGSVDAIVTKRQGRYIVKMPGAVKFGTTNHKLIIGVSPAKMGVLCGLCGDNDGEITSEMIGPQYCVYADPKKFVNAWSVSSESCDLYTLLEKQFEVQEYQKTCEKYNFGNQEVSYDDETVFCEMPLVYSVTHKESKNMTCVTKEPVTHCPDNCVESGRTYSMVNHKCWPDHNMHPDIPGATHLYYPVNDVSAREKVLPSFYPYACIKH